MMTKLFGSLKSPRYEVFAGFGELVLLIWEKSTGKNVMNEPAVHRSIV